MIMKQMSSWLNAHNDIYRHIHPIELERLQTLPDNYTNVEGVGITKRMHHIGNGWTVDIISHILKHIPL